MHRINNYTRGKLTNQFTFFLFVVLFINTTIAVSIAGIHFKNEYIQLLQSRVETVGDNLKNFMQDILELGLPIGSLEGVDKELEKTVTGDLQALYANVVDNQSRVIYSFPTINTGTVFHKEELLPLIEKNSKNTFTTESSYNTFIPITDPLANKVVGGINIGILKNKVFSKTIHSISTLIVTFIGFIIITLMLISWHTKRTIKPLIALNRSALSLGDGDLSVRVETDADNEIGSLAKSFNHMAEQLSNERLKLTAYTNQLERQHNKLLSAHDQIVQREQKLKDAQTQLVLSEKMASLGVLIAGIAHEINTPAGAIANVASDLRGRIETINNSLPDIHDLSQEELLLLQSMAREFDMKEYISEGNVQWKKSRDVRKWLVESGIGNERDIIAVLTKYNLLDKEKLMPYSSILKKTWALSLLDSFGSVNVGMRICESSIKKVSEIVKALKYYAYTDMDKTSLVDMNENIENVLLLMQNKLKYDTEIIKKLAPIPRLHCTSEISQVWTNLISNAHDAITENHRDGDKGVVEIHSCEKDEWICVEVTDNGGGISIENKEKMFDPFFTTKEIGKGTGLGLSIVTGIIKKHHGKISVESVPGRTTVTVMLPKDKGNGNAEIG